MITPSFAGFVTPGPSTGVPLSGEVASRRGQGGKLRLMSLLTTTYAGPFAAQEGRESTTGNYTIAA